MARSDWFQNSRWDESEAQAFFKRLNRARPSNRFQYLRIKAYNLSETNDPVKMDVAVELLLLTCRDFGDGTGATPRLRQWYINSQAEIGHIRHRQGRIDEALAHFRNAIRQEDGAPDSYIISYSQIIYDTKRLTDYAETLALLKESFDRNEEDCEIFRHASFSYAFYQAVLAFELGHMRAAKIHARTATQIVRAPDHGIGKSLSLGVVDATASQIEKLGQILSAG